MRIRLTEPESARYIYINEKTNKVHLLVPIVGGEEISRDNTCKATLLLKNFFGGNAARHLKNYKAALAFDISLLEVGDPRRIAKEDRLAQIEAYLIAIPAMQHSYGDAIRAFEAKPSNLYSIQLRPRDQDSQSLVVNPVFNIDRRNDKEGNPLSALYNAMHSQFYGLKVVATAPDTMLKAEVEATLSTRPTFKEVQAVLTEAFSTRFGLNIDFTHKPDGTDVTQSYIEFIMGLSADLTLASADYKQGYILGLLGVCARDVWDSIPSPPFYSTPQSLSETERAERLSIITQFFLANLNVYCVSKGISTKNIGAILDGSIELSRALVTVVATALSAGDNVEEKIGTFFNENSALFGLSSPLNADQIVAIKEQFKRNYSTITATSENTHMDDFMLLAKEATGEAAKCVIHQSAICVNFAEIIDPVAAASNPGYFESIRADFAVHSAEISHKNKWVDAGEIDVSIEQILQLTDEQFDKLPVLVKDSCRDNPNFHARALLNDVAKGKQAQAQDVLMATPATMQIKLRTPGQFTDYSGRTFNCTAYEYAYWAKDTHMCRMLESFMDDETKAQMLARVDIIESEGLVFQQNGQTYQSAHFELESLKRALQAYLDGYEVWASDHNWPAISAAWLLVGKAQRDLPAHVVQEYCRTGRSFSPTPSFKEETLARTFVYFNDLTHLSDLVFPVQASNAGLGFDFGLLRSSGSNARGRMVMGSMGPACDLRAIIRLDQVRTEDLSISRDRLMPLTSTPGMSK